MKRWIAVLLVLLMSFFASLPVFAAVATNADKWAAASMEYAYQEGILTEAELQNAKSSMSRKDFCKMVLRFLRLATEKEWQATQKTPFSDCDDADVTAAYELGIIGGVEPGIFEPNRTLTREQLAIMLARMIQVCGVDLTTKAKENPFSDTAKLYASSNQYINRLYGAGILSGDTDGGYHPFREMTVQEASVSFVQAYRYIEEETGGAVTIAEPEQQTDTQATTQTAAGTETVTVDGKQIVLGQTVQELMAVWGAPSRKEDTVYGLERYVYLNDYTHYFFVTLQDGCIVEIFVPGTGFSYVGVNPKGTMADIQNLSHISSLEHSGILSNTLSEVRIPFDYEGNVCGLLLQTKAFATGDFLQSTLQYATKEAVEAELLDLIQVCRMNKGLPLLQEDKKLAGAADAHSKDMTEKNYFDYIGSDGSTSFQRIAAAGKTFHTASETIAKQRGDVVNIYQEWMRVAVKYNSLTDASVQEVGVGVSVKSKELYVTVDFCG